RVTDHDERHAVLLDEVRDRPQVRGRTRPDGAERHRHAPGVVRDRHADPRVPEIEPEDPAGLSHRPAGAPSAWARPRRGPPGTRPPWGRRRTRGWACLPYPRPRSSPPARGAPVRPAPLRSAASYPPPPAGACGAA